MLQQRKSNATRKIVKANHSSRALSAKSEVITDPQFLALQKNVLEHPHSSENWIRLIAYYVEKGSVEEARKQTKKALAVVSFTSEMEKLNLWKSFINLEFNYGSGKSLLDIYRQASCACGLEHICQHLLALFKAKGMFEAGDFYVKDLLKKSKDRFLAWKIALGFYVDWREQHKDKEGEREAEEQVKEILRRALQSLPLNRHIEFISQYAKLEYHCNALDTARMNFENLLSNFPRRNDIWSVYLDYEMKYAQDVEYARTLFERVTSIKKSLKQTKFFFKKFLDFETKFGDKKTQKAVMAKAKEFVDNYVAQHPGDEEDEQPEN